MIIVDSSSFLQEKTYRKIGLHDKLPTNLTNLPHILLDDV